MKIKMKPYILILSYKNSKNIKKINDDRFLYNYFIADPSLDTDYKKSEEEDDNKIFIKCEENIPSKLFFLSIKYIKRYLYKKIYGVFKTDDDVELDLNELYDYLEKNKEIDYFGKVYESTSHTSNYYFNKFGTNKDMVIPQCKYCNGIGYYISKKMIPFIIKNEEDSDKIIYEDLFVGVSLNKNDIYPKIVNVERDFVKNINSIKPPEDKPKEIVNTPPTKRNPILINNQSNLCKYCGYPKNKIRYNFCQNCGRLY
jgi:hypothetical protein